MVDIHAYIRCCNIHAYIRCVIFLHILDVVIFMQIWDAMTFMHICDAVIFMPILDAVVLMYILDAVICKHVFDAVIFIGTMLRLELNNFIGRSVKGPFRSRAFHFRSRGPEPSHRINLIKRCRLHQTRASGVSFRSKYECGVQCQLQSLPRWFPGGSQGPCRSLKVP